MIFLLGILDVKIFSKILIFNNNKYYKLYNYELL